MFKIWWIWKFREIRSEKLIDGHQTVPYQPGALLWRSQLLVVFATYFNLNDSLLKLLQIKFHSYSGGTDPP